MAQRLELPVKPVESNVEVEMLPSGLVWDLYKAYHSPSVAFGDVSASVFLELVKELAGVLGVEIDAEPSKKIADDGYVDDNLGGG